MLCSYVFLLLLSSTRIIASPLLKKRIDLDGNGVPDWCNFDSDGKAHCLKSDGSWVVVQPGSDSPPTHPTVQILVDTVIAASSATTLPSPSPETTTSAEILPTGSLPAASQFQLENGTKWKLEYVGDIQYTGELSGKDLVGDKCRSSQIGDKIIWNCGDMMCANDWTVCGFAMGPAMYGTDDVMTINTTGIVHIQNNDFLNPWAEDPAPEMPQTHWGMDQSNIAPLNDTHGVIYGYEIWRGALDESFVRQGNAVGLVSLGEDKPVATRMGPLLTGPDALELGLLAILRDGDYIYIYSEGGPSRLTVTRVPANADAVFDPTHYETLLHDSLDTWEPAIPTFLDTKYGMSTANTDGIFGCSVYGSVFYSNYFNKYVIICNIYMDATNMYVSDTPYGPWSEEYNLLSGWNGYGSMVHPMYSPGGSHKELYFSLGPNAKFNMFKLTFDY
jgi:hypothetical protein